MKGNLKIVEKTHGVSFEVKVGKAELYLAAVVDRDVPEALGRVSVRQWIVGRHETSRSATQLAAASYTRGHTKAAAYIDD